MSHTRGRGVEIYHPPPCRRARARTARLRGFSAHCLVPLADAIKIVDNAIGVGVDLERDGDDIMRTNQLLAEFAVALTINNGVSRFWIDLERDGQMIARDAIGLEPENKAVLAIPPREDLAAWLIEGLPLGAETHEL
jgi:hypothetical protein